MDQASSVGSRVHYTHSHHKKQPTKYGSSALLFLGLHSLPFGLPFPAATAKISLSKSPSLLQFCQLPPQHKSRKASCFAAFLMLLNILQLVIGQLDDFTPRDNILRFQADKLSGRYLIKFLLHLHSPPSKTHTINTALSSYPPVLPYHPKRMPWQNRRSASLHQSD